MRKNAKMIEIRGFKGLLIAIFMVVCLCAGFIAFPGLIAMHTWNHFDVMPKINLIQGVMLWAIIALIYFIANKQRFGISFGSPQELDDEEMKILMEKIKLQSQAKMINKIMMEELKNKEKSEDNVNKE